MGNKRTYEDVEIEVINLGQSDVITSSSPFDGEDDLVTEW